MSLEKYNISNVSKSIEQELRRRKKKWGFGKIYTNEVADINNCAINWKDKQIKIYPEINIYDIDTETSLLYIKKHRSKTNFLSSWWVDDELGRNLTGSEKWDYLIKSMTEYGWDNLQPACVWIRTIKNPCIINGHHRIAVANHLGIRKIPINFIYSEHKTK